MKVCFLDIDGVLNYAEYGEDTYYDKYYDKEVALDDLCIERLRKLLERFPDLKIVWSTDWRFIDGDYHVRWKHPLKWLEANCPWLRERVIGKTPKKMSSERWREVKWWLDADHNAEEVDAYVVLDDIVFPRDWFGIEKHCVECKTGHGFDDECLKQAVEILERGGSYVQRLPDEERD